MSGLPPAAPRRRRRLLWASGGLLAALLLAVCTIFVGLPLIAASDGFRRSLERRATAALGRPVWIGKVRLGLLGGLALDLSDLRLANPEGFPAPDLALVREVRAEALLSSLWRDAVVVERLTLRKVAVALERRADGRTNLGGLVLALPAPARPGSRLAAMAPGPALEISRIRLEDARVTFRDAVSGRSAEAEDLTLDARVRDLPLGEAAPATLLQRAAFQGTLVIGRIRSEGLALEGLRCGLSLDRGLASLQEGQAVLNGGSLAFTAQGDFQNAGRPRFAVKTSLSGVRLTPALGQGYLGRFLACFAGEMEGEIQTGELDLSWQGLTREALNASLQGKGSLALSVKVLDLTPLLPEIFKLEPAAVTFTEVSFAFSVGNGVVRSTIRLSAPGNGAEMSGTMRLDTQEAEYLLVCTGRLGELTYGRGIPLKGPITALKPQWDALVKDAVKDQLPDALKPFLP